MLRLIASGLLLILVVGCGRPNINLDPETEEYVARFEEQWGESIDIDLTVKIDKIDSGIAGICYTGSGTVILQRDFWDNANDASKEQLVFHELGHCVLMIMEHREKKRSDSCPKSIMYPWMFSSNCYVTHHAYFIRELF